MQPVAYLCLLLTLITCSSELCGGEGRERPLFDPPIGGWPADPPRGAINSAFKLSGLEDRSRAWFGLGVPDGSLKTPGTETSPRYSADCAWPLVIVLHGGPGTDGSNLVPFFRKRLMAQGMIAAFPTAIDDQLLAWSYPGEIATVLRTIREVTQRYRIDPHQVFLIGHSMGGGGTYLQGDVLRSLWAGTAPISGWWGPLSAARADAERQRDLPIFIIHGINDVQVPIANGGDPAYAALTAAGNTTVTLVRVEGGNHGNFLTAGSSVPSMLTWLSQQRRAKPADPGQAWLDLLEYGQKRYAFGWFPGASPIGVYAGGPPGNQPPVISGCAYSLPEGTLAPTVGLPLRFEVVATDPDSDPVSVRLDFGDGSSAWTARASFTASEGRAVVHTYRDPGSYTVQVHAGDRHGLVSTTTVPVRVVAGPAATAKPRITGPRSERGSVGQAFSARIVANNEPTLYHIAGLPPFLTLNPETGEITGTPDSAGTWPITLRAFNDAGSHQLEARLLIQTAGRR